MEITIKIDDKEIEKMKKKEPVEDEPKYSRYSRIIDCSMILKTIYGVPWTKDDLRYVLSRIQDHANNLLRSREIIVDGKCVRPGWLYLNEVLDMLGLSTRYEERYVGWAYYKDNPVGDNYVDFRLYDIDNRNYWVTFDKGFILDFNVDGNILI